MKAGNPGRGIVRSVARLLLALPSMPLLMGTVPGADALAAPVEAAQQARKGPEAPPFRAITGFSSALRCMDNQMVSYGVRDVGMLVEDLQDQTRKVAAGTKDMLISAISEMTKRSRAIRLIAYGQDSGNLIGFMQAAGTKAAYAQLPQFDIRGSISQFDENVASGGKSFGLGLGLFNFGHNTATSATVLGIDLNVVNTADMSVIPGVSSRNGVLVVRDGSGADARGEAQTTKFGINFSTSLNKNEGNSQALRTLVELAAIELVGKLTKVPYWKCLGADEKSPAVAEEIEDWFFAMSGNAAETLNYFQYQLAVRGFYRGPVDGVVSAELAHALSDLRAALGLTAEPEVNHELFAAYLNADPAKLKPTRVSTRTETPKPPALTLEIAPEQAGPRARGEPVRLSVRPSRDAYVYCYLWDEQRALRRLFPNHFAPSALVKPGQALELPGRMGFEITASDSGASETVACFATAAEVLATLPKPWTTPEFDAIPGMDLPQLEAAMLAASAGGAAQARHTVVVK